MKKQKIFDGSTIEYFATVATIAKDPDRKFHWSNVYVGLPRQVIIVKWAKGRISILDNEDGAAWIKIKTGWWPNRPHREISAINEPIESLIELPESEYNIWDEEKYRTIDYVVNCYNEQNFKDDPEWERLKSLKELATKFTSRRPKIF